jgi:DNA replication protein DnaC
MTAAFTPAMGDRMGELLGLFKLPTVSSQVIKRFEKANHHAALSTLLEVLEAEASDRRERRVERLTRAAKLPPGKSFDTFNDARLPRPLVAQLRELAAGHFLDRAANVLCFGLPGVGKTHAACALGHALVHAGRSVLFVPTYQLVQERLVAKRDLSLPRALHGPRGACARRRRRGRRARDGARERPRCRARWRGAFCPCRSGRR